MSKSKQAKLCAVPSGDPPYGGDPLLCDREAGHRGQHARTVAEEDGEHTYRWGGRSGPSGPSKSHAQRRAEGRTLVQVELRDHELAVLDQAVAYLRSSRAGALRSAIGLLGTWMDRTTAKIAGVAAGGK